MSGVSAAPAKAEGGTKVKIRELRSYEVICSYMNIGICLQFKNDLLLADIESAWRKTRKEHPYLRYTIQEIQGQRYFVEQQGSGSAKVPVEVHASTAAVNSTRWQERLLRICQAQRDHAKSLVYFELFGDRELQAVVNHAGIDGPGVFHVFDSFCGYLGGTDQKAERSFFDIHVRENYCADLAISKTGVPDNELVPRLLKAPGPFPEKGVTLEQGAQGRIKAVYTSLSEQQTTQLVLNCKSIGTTVQAAVSVAGFLATVALAIRETPGETLPVTVRAQVPINMRKMMKGDVKASDAVCGSSALWWTQKVELSRSLWDLAKEAKAGMQSSLDRNDCLRFWQELKAGTLNRPVTNMASSIGINPMKSQYGNGVELKEVFLTGGAYFVPTSGTGSNMTHIHTFDSKLRASYSYTWPLWSEKVGSFVASAQENILLLFADANAKDYSVEKVLKLLQ